MSDISISFPAWMVAWFLLGEATPFITLAMAGLIAAYFFARRGGRVRPRRWLTAGLVIVGAAWLAGITFWAAGLVDEIKTDIYKALHHYRLDNATDMAGIEIPKGSWVSVDENGVLYGIETAPDAVLSIDGAPWRGDIRLAGLGSRAASDRATVKSATLAADAVIQGISCRAGNPVEFAESGGDLLNCTLTQRTVVTAEIADVAGDRSTTDLACAADRDIVLRSFQHRLLERCILAEAATVGPVGCAGGAEIVLAGDGLVACTLASAQRVGPFDLAAATPVGFMRGRLDRFDMPLTSAPLAISRLYLPPGTTVHLCEQSWEIDWVSVPENGYVTIADVKLTGRMNFDCGKFEYGSLFEDTVLRGKMLPRGATVSHEDVFPPALR